MTPPRRPEATAVLADGCLAGRVALVTGGGSGIGRATAELLARLGAVVAIAGRQEDRLKATVEAIAASGGRATAHPCDIREPEAVDAMIDAVLGAHGRIDLLVNNAGGQFVAPAEQISYNGFRAVTRLNLDATWYVTTQVAAGSMIPAGYGKVVSVTMTPTRGMPGMAHSSAARAGVESLTRTWAAEWARFGVRTVAVAPGIVHTEGWEKYGLTPEHVSKVIPVGRVQAADEVAAVIAFCLSPAGDYIIGTTIVADGGINVSAPGSLVD